MRTHIIRAGDTYDLIAYQNDCSINDLMLCNPAMDPKELQPGDKVYVPEKINTFIVKFCLCADFLTNSIINPLTSIFDISLPRLSMKYKIKEHDTFGKLARYYLCSTEDIKSVNPDVREEQLEIGQIINLPNKRNQSLLSFYIITFVGFILSRIAKPSTMVLETSSIDVRRSEPCSDIVQENPINGAILNE